MSRTYRKGEVLGIGAFATVFEGWDVLLDRAVAIKELTQPFAANELFVRAFFGRALEMLDIAQEHVLVTYAADSSQHPPAIVRELADQTLETVAIASPLSPEEVEEILRQALSGLAALHGRALLHGAIKPQNLFRSGKHYKIGDFGTLLVPGGPHLPPRERRYTAPEALREEACGPAADIYSLGLVAYELLVGPLRFERIGEELARQAGIGSEGDHRAAASDNLWPLLNASAVEIPPPHELASGLPMALSLTIHQMTRKDASERFSGTQAVLASLGAARPAAAAVISPPRISSAARTHGGSSPAQRLGQQGLPTAGEKKARRAAGTPVRIAAGGLAAALLTGLGWLLASHGQSAQPTSLPASSPCPPRGIEGAADAASLGQALRRLVSAGSTLAIDLDRAHDGSLVRTSLGTPLRFRLTSDRPGHFALFVLSSDGGLTSLCSNPRRPDPALSDPQGGSLVLPSEMDQRAGFALSATEPLGRDLVFALRSAVRLSPPVGRVSSSWTREYALADGTSGAFVAWVAQLRCQHSGDVTLAMRELEVVPTP